MKDLYLVRHETDIDMGSGCYYDFKDLLNNLKEYIINYVTDALDADAIKHAFKIYDDIIESGLSEHSIIVAYASFGFIVMPIHKVVEDLEEVAQYLRSVQSSNANEKIISDIVHAKNSIKDYFDK